MCALLTRAALLLPPHRFGFSLYTGGYAHTTVKWSIINIYCVSNIFLYLTTLKKAKRAIEH